MPGGSFYLLINQWFGRVRGKGNLTPSWQEGHVIAITETYSVSCTSEQGEKITWRKCLGIKMKRNYFWHYFCWCVRNTKDRENIVRLVYLLALSVPCWVFMHTRLLKNMKPENPGKLSWNAPHMCSVKYCYSNIFYQWIWCRRILNSLVALIYSTLILTLLYHI